MTSKVKLILLRNRKLK